jgi:hypothetical protein
MTDHERAVEYKPTFQLSVYQDWIARKLGTPEQLRRYREAVEWYTRQEKLAGMEIKPNAQNPT